MILTRFHSTQVVIDGNISEVRKIDQEYSVTYKTDKITRDDYILSCWNEKFPNSQTDDINRVRSFISSSAKMQEWYADIMTNYQANVVMPDYLKDVLDIDEYNKLSVKLKEYNNKLKARSDAINKAAANFKNALDAANATYEKSCNSLLKDKVLFVLTLNRSDLPLDLQQQIIDFVPKDVESPKERREHAKNLVIEFQKSLIKSIKNDEKFSPSDYVNSKRDVFRDSTFPD